jgi:hypothetical protein
VLSAGKQVIELILRDHVLVRIAREPITGIAGFSIPYDPAVYDEPDDEELLQLDLFAPFDSDDMQVEDDGFYI